MVVDLMVSPGKMCKSVGAKPVRRAPQDTLSLTRRELMHASLCLTCSLTLRSRERYRSANP